MYWINKQNGKFRRRGHKWAKSFLSVGWNTTLAEYVNCNYTNYKRDYPIENLLYEEQHHYCCYCMRRLSLGVNSTIEHVLPHMSDDSTKEGRDDIAYYLNQHKFLRKNVYFALLDKAHPQSKNRIKKFPPFPHFCAYENLVLSCDGSVWDGAFPGKDKVRKLHETCNNLRGSQRIIPLYFIRNIKKILRYHKDGSLIYDDVYYPTIKAVGLNHKTLNLIRKTWAQLALVSSIPEVNNAIENEELRDTIISLCDLNPFEINRLRNSDLWRLLSEYSWFYKYYKKQK